MNSFAHESYENIDAKFDAVLKTLAGKTLEVGRGQFDPENHSVDFECDFIPLFAMGTRLQILRLYEDIEVHRFTGEVYFSSAGRLRLVSVQDEVLPDAAMIFLYYVDLAGTAQTTVQAEHRGLFGKKLVEETVEFPVKVRALSSREVMFHTDLSVELDPEQPVTVTVAPGPELPRLPMVVKQAIVFGQEANCYRCRLLPLHTADETLFKLYIFELSTTDTPKAL